MEAILNNLIRATGWSIFHSLWQAAIMYGVLLLVVHTIPTLKAKVRHDLSYGSLIIMFISFVFTFLTIFKIPTSNGDSTVALLTTGNIEHGTYFLSWPAEFGDKAERIFPLMVAVYTVGLLIQLFVLSNGFIKLGTLKRDGHQEIPEQWQDVFNHLISKLGIRSNITFKLSSLVNVPLVVGYLKPIVLFPVTLATQLDINQVEAILIHELSHIRRNDYLLNLIKTAIETILFFNPFVWLTSRLINIEREHACDDLVLNITGTPITYAHALLKLEILKEKGSPVLAMASTGKNNHLYQRIKRITDMKTNYMNSKQQFFAVALTMAVIISLAWVSPANKEVQKVSIKQQTKVLNLLSTSVTEVKIDTVPARSLKSDTTKKKRTVKIVTVHGKGNQVTYNSVSEMPDSLKVDVLTDSKFDFDFKGFDFDFKTAFKGLDTVWTEAFSYMKSPEYKKEIGDALAYMKSPEYKKELGDAIAHMKSPEYKKEVSDAMAYMRSPEFKKELRKSTEASTAYFKSADWKKQQLESIKSITDMKKTMNSKEFKAAQEELLKNSQELKLQFSGPEYKKQIEALKELKSSEEYKLLKEKFDKDLENLKEKKGIKTDIKIGS
jgi:bla regulator protein BlaR1